MKTHIFHFNEPAAIDDEVFSAMPTDRPLLVQAYVSEHPQTWILSLQRVLQRCLPQAILAGMTSHGQIAHDVIKQQGMSVFITQFTQSFCQQVLLPADADEENKLAVLQDLLQPNTKVLIIHSSDLQSRHANLLPLISQIAPDVVVSGAVAQPIGADLYSCVFTQQQVHEDAFLLTALNGQHLIAHSVLKQNWFAIGKPLQVSAAKDFLVHTIDGLSVVELYKRYLGPGVANHLPAASSMFPLLFDDGVHQTTAFVLKTLADGSAVFNRKIANGQQVRLAFANMNSLLDNSYLYQAGPLTAEQVFVFSCCVRLDLLKDNIVEEISPLAAKLPVCGGFGFGEMAMDGQGKAGLFSHSMSLLFLGEQADTISFEQTIPEHAEPARQGFELTTKELISIYSNLTRALMQDLKESNANLTHLTLTDHLTGIANRSMLDSELRKLRQLYQRYQRPLSILLLDLDHFKRVNDTFGHLNGDKVLIATAKTLSEQVRETDIAGRWGGEEFLVICPDTPLAEAYQLAERLRLTIAALHIRSNEGTINVTTSIGVAALSGQMNIDELLRVADVHLYQAKTQGRNQVV